MGKKAGCSAVRLAHLLWEQGVEGSNPFTPTKTTKGRISKAFALIYALFYELKDMFYSEVGSPTPFYFKLSG